MKPKEALIALALICVTYAGVSTFAAYLENTKEIRLAELKSQRKQKEITARLEERKFDNEQDVKRLMLFTHATQRNALTEPLRAEMDALLFHKIKAAAIAENSTISGIALDKELAKELIKSGSITPQETQINENFELLRIDWNSPNKITLKSLSDDRVITAIFDLDWMPLESGAILQEAEWNRESGRLLRAYINARIVKDKVISAHLVKVERFSRPQ